MRRPCRSSGVRIGEFAVNWRAPADQAPSVRIPEASAKLSITVADSSLAMKAARCSGPSKAYAASITEIGA